MFYLFAGFLYYPRGGMDDFQGSFDTIDLAMEFLSNSPFDWYQISDREMQVVKRGTLM